MRWLAIAIVLGAAPIAIADPADPTEAGAIFQQGRELAKQGRYVEACELFAKSYELDPALGTAVNLADCLERQGQLRRAWELFDVVARNSQNVQSRARLARERADALVAKLTTVVITLRAPLPAGLAVRLGERELAPAAEIRDLIEPHDVELVATAPGRPAFRTLVHAVAGATLTVEIPPFAALAALADSAPSPAATFRRRSRVYMAAGIGGGALVSFGVSLGFALSARRIYDDAFDGACRRDPAHGVVCSDAGSRSIDRSHRRADLATGFAIGGAVLAGAAAAVWFTAPRDTVQLAPIADHRALGLGIVGRF